MSASTAEYRGTAIGSQRSEGTSVVMMFWIAEKGEKLALVAQASGRR